MVIKTFAHQDEINFINRNGYQLLSREIVGISFFGRMFAARPIPSKFQSCEKMKFLKTPKQIVTIKIVYLDVGFEQMRNLNWIIAKEVATMNRCFGNPNILGLLDIFIGAKRVFLVFEYAEKENLTVLLSRPRTTYMKEKEALGYIRGACLGLKTLHSLGTAHGDLNPDSIFVTKANRAKLGEFSFVKTTKNSCLFLDDEENERDIQKKTSNVFGGAINYAAPEVLDDSIVDYDEQAADIWSLGATLYLLLNGRLPFQGQSKEEILHWQHKYFNNEARMVFVKTTSASCRQLVWNMLSQDPKSRPTVWDLLESKSLKRYKSKEESLQMGNLTTKRLLKIFENKKYGNQQKVLTKYIQSRQKLLEEIHSCRKSDEDCPKFVAIPFNNNGVKREEIWRMTMGRNTYLYGMTSISHFDPSKVKVFRDLSQFKGWQNMNKTNNSTSEINVPAPSSRYPTESDDADGKCVFCEESSEFYMKKSEKTGGEKESSIKDSRKALQNWLSIDFDKTTRSNKDSLRPYEINPMYTDLVLEKPTTSLTGLKQIVECAESQESKNTSFKTADNKTKSTKNESNAPRKIQKNKQTQSAKVVVRKEVVKKESAVKDNAIRVKTNVKSVGREKEKIKPWSESLRKSKSASFKTAKNAKPPVAEKAFSKKKNGVNKSKSAVIQARKVQELAPSCSYMIKPESVPCEANDCLGLSLSSEPEFDDSDLPILLLTETIPDVRKRAAILKEKIQLFDQEEPTRSINLKSGRKSQMMNFLGESEPRISEIENEDDASCFARSDMALY